MRKRETQQQQQQQQQKLSPSLCPSLSPPTTSSRHLFREEGRRPGGIQLRRASRGVMHDGPRDGAQRGREEKKERRERERGRAGERRKKKNSLFLHLHPQLFTSSLSFSLLSPIPQGAPDDPRFKQVLAESDALLQNNFGAMLSPSQSLPSAIGPGQATNFGSLDQSLISEQRFATPYLKRVWAANALWHATHK